MAALHLARRGARSEERGRRGRTDGGGEGRGEERSVRPPPPVSFTYHIHAGKVSVVNRGRGIMANPQSLQRRMKEGTNTNRARERTSSASWSLLLFSKTKKSSKWDAPSLGPCSAAWLAACGPSRRDGWSCCKNHFSLRRQQPPPPPPLQSEDGEGTDTDGVCVGLGGAVGKMGLPSAHSTRRSTPHSTQSGLQVEAKAQKMNRRRREVRSRRVATHGTRNPHDGREQAQKQGRKERKREGGRERRCGMCAE